MKQEKKKQNKNKNPPHVIFKIKKNKGKRKNGKNPRK